MMSDSDSLSSVGTPVSHDPFAGLQPTVLEPTETQLEIWLSSQSRESSLAYNESFALRLRGNYDAEALEHALRTLPDLHESLRGRFGTDGQTFTIDPVLNIEVTRHDLSSVPSAEREKALEEVLKADATTPFDLEHGPLYRASLIVLDEGECVALFGAHHSVCDGWSLDVLLLDLSRLYSAFIGAAGLPAPPEHAFSDYVAHCKREEHRKWSASSRDFWRKTFDPLPPPLTLPADGARPDVRSYPAQHVLRVTDGELVNRLKAISREHGLSFFSFVFSGFFALLNRISGEKDLVVGVPIAGHPEADMEDCVGHMVNMVPVRCTVRPEQSFLELCRSCNGNMLDARENAGVGFREILASLPLPRDPARIPLASCIFTHVQKYAPGKLVFPECSFEYHLSPRSYEAFELNLNVIESHDALELHAYANADLFSQEWLELRMREFQQLLESVCENPECPVGRLRIVPAEELARIESFNETAADYPRDAPLSRLFEDQAKRTPDAVAVRQADRTVTYAQLDARANQLARALRKRGVKPGALVGLCLERTPDMVAAVFAVLKAGGAYIPLDPAFPPSRLAFMVEDAGLLLVVSEASLAELHGCARDRRLELDSDRTEIEAEPAEPLGADGAQAGPEDTAYVLYTSGSTGKPKGVCVPHRAGVNFITSMQREPGLEAKERLLAVTTLSFDIALLELMLPLSVGAEIVLATQDQSRDALALARLLDAHGVMVMQATPATWRMLIESGWKGSDSFRALCGGEAMPLDLAEALLARAGQVWNMYGPTETTVWSTCSLVKNPRAGITIGRPIANTTVWILDAEGQRCPLGVPGEIFIGGDGVALGYLNRPELTGNRFISDPFSSAPGAKLYKTGDLGRWRSDGQLDCLGRNDFQVKVRGYRIELGEIESTLVEHGWLKEAAVVPRPAPSGELQLVAYGIAAPGRTGDAQTLFEFAGERLPSYMVPSALVLLEAFPLTPNGKLDRKALPAPQGATHAPLKKTAPRTPIEESLAAVFCNVLKISDVGIDDNFFDLGGSSLQTIHVVDRLSKRGITVPPVHMFRYPTIRQLANQVGTRRASSTEEDALGSLLVLQEHGSRPPLFLMHSMPGDLLGYGDLVHAIGSDQPVYGFHGLGSYSESIREIRDLAALYARRLMAFRPTGTLHLAGWCFGGTVTAELATILRDHGRKVGFVGLLEASPYRSKLNSRAHLLKAVVEGKTAKPPSLSAIVKRATRRSAEQEEREADAFALEITDGPFANRAKNYARNRSAAARHRTRYYAGPVALVRAGVDSRVLVERDYGWSDFAESVNLLTVDTEHTAILRPPYCQEVAQFIRDNIDAAEQRES